MDIGGDSKITESIKTDKNVSIYSLFKEYNRFSSYGMFVLFINTLIIWIFLISYFLLGYLKINIT